MREVEIKSVVEDLDARVRTLAEKGGRLVFEGRLEDRRYDTSDQALMARDELLRLRTYRREAGPDTALEWKGPRAIENGYRVREEQSVNAGSLETLELILDRLGYRVTRAIDRHIVQFELGEAVVRFERYPRMDDLVEVEGEPAAIERAVVALGMAREGFTGDSLAAFVERYESRTGRRAALADADLTFVAGVGRGDGDNGDRR